MERIRKQNPLLSLMNYTQSYGGSPVIGIVNKNDTAAVNAMLASKIARDILPSDLILRWTVKAIDEKETLYQLIALKAGKAPLGGDVIIDARDDFDKIQGSVVSMTMNAEGAKVWEKLTRDNIGNAIAIVLDNQVYSFPNVNGAISGGSSHRSFAGTRGYPKRFDFVLGGFGVVDGLSDHNVRVDSGSYRQFRCYM